jgi:hypothetical protein
LISEFIEPPPLLVAILELWRSIEGTDCSASCPRSEQERNDLLFYSTRRWLGDRSGTCINPKMQVVQGKSVCVVTCQRSPEPVFLKWKGIEGTPQGDFFVRSGPGTIRLAPDSAKEYIRTRFAAVASARVPHS